MKEGEIWKAAKEKGVMPQSYRNIGDDFQEWTFLPMKDIDMKDFFHMLRHYDFYELRIDLPEDEQFSALRGLY